MRAVLTTDLEQNTECSRRTRSCVGYGGCNASAFCCCEVPATIQPGHRFDRLVHERYGRELTNYPRRRRPVWIWSLWVVLIGYVHHKHASLIYMITIKLASDLDLHACLPATEANPTGDQPQRHPRSIVNLLTSRWASASIGRGQRAAVHETSFIAL